MTLIPSGFNGDIPGDLAKQQAAAQDRHLVPPNPTDFLKWITETLRDHRSKYEKLMSAHKDLNKKSDLATVGLKRLESLVTFKDRDRLNYLKDTHRNLSEQNTGIGYTLDRCGRVLEETTVNYQLIGETLKSALADRHKKQGMRKEIGLRLKDVDADFTRCFQAVALQKKQMRQLSEGIQKLMHKASIKLPPKVRETINREDQVSKIAMMHNKSLSKGKDKINQTKYNPAQDRAMNGYLNGINGFADEVPADETPEAKSGIMPLKSVAEKTGIDVRLAVAAVAAGLTLGFVVFRGN